MLFRTIAAVCTPIGAIGGAAEPEVLGTELWVQPAFDASTSVTLTAVEGDPPVISGGTCTWDVNADVARATATALDTLDAGDYRVTYEVSTGTAQGGLTITIANTNANNRVKSAGVQTYIHTVSSAVTQTIIITGNFTDVALTSFSVKKIQ